MSKAKILILDIERSFNLAAVYKMWGDQYISPDAMLSAGEMIAFAAKWYKESKSFYWSEYDHGKQPMVEAIHALLDEADVVVGYNSTPFDIPHIQQEMFLAKLSPPSPYKQIDLLKVVRKEFNFPYNSLDHIAKTFGVGGKTQKIGIDLWIAAVINRDPKAWATIKKYNINDVKITEGVYEQLVPWMKNHPNVAAYMDDRGGCPHCGEATKLQKRGIERPTGSAAYQRYQCMGCMGWSKGTKAIKEDSSDVLVLRSM